MHISRLQIKNFRNFQNLDLKLDQNVVIVGENRVGKSNLIYALRLLLDPSLSDNDRLLQEEDFWDGLPRPLTKTDEITISIEIADVNDDKELCILGDYISDTNPEIYKISYIYKALPNTENYPDSQSDYSFSVYGGNSDTSNSQIDFEFRRQIQFITLPALRDSESDLGNWYRSPLRPLLDEIIESIPKGKIKEIASALEIANDIITEIPAIHKVASRLSDRLEQTIGPESSTEFQLRLSSASPERLLRTLKPYIDQGRRSISGASLGTSNLLYIILKELHLEKLYDDHQLVYAFLAIEEPEAHLHPHSQRLLYRDFLKSRRHQKENSDEVKHRTVLLTTHSPHIISVTPIKSLVVLRHDKKTACSTGRTTANLDLDANDIADLERYIDVTRGEILFARGVILVEGDAEAYLIPALASKIGFNLDHFGITVCSVSGTNFLPYVKFLGKSGIDIPFAILTDNDPKENGSPLSETRINRIIEYITSVNDEPILPLPEDYGIFVNSHTLEIDLFEIIAPDICTTIKQLTINGAAVKRANSMYLDNDSLNTHNLLEDINSIGKGRFSQRLATNLSTSACPNYIRGALNFVKSKVSSL